MTEYWETLVRPWSSFLFQVLFTSSHDMAGHWVDYQTLLGAPQLDLCLNEMCIQV